MAKLEGVKTLDMVSGEVTKVEYEGAVYEKVDDAVSVGDIVLSTGVLDSAEGNYYVTKEGDYGNPAIYDDVGEHRDNLKQFTVFRNPSAPTLESDDERINEIDTKVDALAERVTALEDERKDGDRPSTVKRKARVGERILITNAEITGGKYSNGDIRTVKESFSVGVIVEEHSIGILHREYEVIVDDASNSTTTFKEGDRVRALSDGEFNDIKKGEIGIIETTFSTEMEGDPYTIGVDVDGDGYDYFRPQDLELATEASVGDFVKVTKSNYARVRGCAGFGKRGQGLVNIGSVGEVVDTCVEGVYVKFDSEENGSIFEEYGGRFFLEEGEYEIANKPKETIKNGDIVVITGDEKRESRGCQNNVGDVGKIVGEGDGGRSFAIEVPGGHTSANYTHKDEVRPATDEEKAEYGRAVKPTLKVGEHVKITRKMPHYDNDKAYEIVRSGDNLGVIDEDGEFNDGAIVDGEYEIIDEKDNKLPKTGRKPGEFKKGDIGRVSWISGRGVVDEVVEIHSGPYGFMDGGNYLLNDGREGTLGSQIELIAPVESRVDVE